MLRMAASFMSRNPFLGPVSAAGILSCAGDIMAQQLIERKGTKHDLRRTLRAQLLAYGFGCWIVTLSMGMPLQVALDQLVFSPTFLAVFFTYNGLMEGQGISGVKQKFKTSYFEAITTCLKVWPLVQMVNFFLIPLHFRVLFVNMIALGWTAFLSTLNSRTHTPIHVDDTVMQEEPMAPIKQVRNF